MMLGRGVLGWNREERVTNRYGSVQLTNAPYAKGPVTELVLDEDATREVVGRKVRLTALVIEARTSGHAGDLSLNIAPSTPEVGEVVALGVGFLALTVRDDLRCFVLVPDDDRAELWIDPRLLYRLHDQTVELIAEPTDDPCHPAPALSAESGVISTGDGAFQCKRTRVPEGARIDVPSEVESLGDGMFLLSAKTPEKGTPLRVLR